MTIASSAYLATNANNRLAWGTELDASDSTPKEILGSVRWDVHPIWGLRGFEYVRFHDAAVVGSWNTQIAAVDINSVTAATTTSVTEVASMSVVDLYKGCILHCYDDTGAAGAAPEGENARIVSNTLDVVYIDEDDAFSIVPTAGDDFEILCPFRVSAAGAGDESMLCRGVAMTTHTIYYYGWVQFYGWNPVCKLVAAGTTITAPGGIITGTGGTATVSSTSAANILVGSMIGQDIATDTVVRTGLVNIKTGVAGTTLATI